MKKIISLLLSIIIVFSASCYSISASVFPFEFYDEFLESEEADFPCYINLDIFVFGENSFNEKLSQGVASVEYTEEGTAIIVPDANANSIKAYFNISNECYSKMGKAFRAIKFNEEQYNCYLRSGKIIPDTDYAYSNYNGYISLLDENLNVVSQARSNGTCNLKPAISKYLCLQIDNSDVDEEEKALSIFITKLKFEWISGNCDLVTETRGEKCEIRHRVTYCKICSHKFSDVVLGPLENHTLTEAPEVSATCNSTGIEEGVVCSVCEAVLSGRSVIPKLPHNEIVIKDKKETYFTKGYTGDTVCADCGEVINKGKIIAKLTLKVPKFKLVKGKGKFKVKYTKAKDATGFQVRYRLDNKKWKSVKVDTKKGVTKVIKNLKKGKYQVKLRAFVKQNKKYAYSQWSDIKTVKVK